MSRVHPNYKIKMYDTFQFLLNLNLLIIYRIFLEIKCNIFIIYSLHIIHEVIQFYSFYKWNYYFNSLHYPESILKEDLVKRFLQVSFL